MDIDGGKKIEYFDLKNIGPGSIVLIIGPSITGKTTIAENIKLSHPNCIIMDDMQETDFVEKKNMLDKLFFMPRPGRLFIVIVIANIDILPHCYEKCVDYIIITNLCGELKKERLSIQFWNDEWGNKEFMEKCIKKIINVSEHRFMVIYNRYDVFWGRVKL